jgi:lysozyme
VGHAITYQGRFLKGAADKAQVQSLYPGGITLAQAEALLHTDLMNAGRDVSSVVLVSLNDNEFGALTSFTFNLGIGNLRSSTLLKMLNANNRAGAADQFGRWVMADGKPLPGLVKRRAAERDLFLTPVVSPAEHPHPSPPYHLHKQPEEKTMNTLSFLFSTLQRCFVAVFLLCGLPASAADACAFDRYCCR